MSSGTIAQTRDGFSRIIHQLETGELAEHYVTNRNRPVVMMVPANHTRDVSRRIGARRGKWGSFDYAQFQALDSEIADSMGV